MVLQACPPNRRVSFHLDSLAALGALTVGHVSERRRVRAAGRPWLNSCRAIVINNRHNISFQHVYSHSGGSSPEEVGNDQADHLANHFRIRGKKTAPSPYLSNFEEAFSFVHGAVRIQSDPSLKSVCFCVCG